MNLHKIYDDLYKLNNEWIFIKPNFSNPQGLQYNELGIRVKHPKKLYESSVPGLNAPVYSLLKISQSIEKSGDTEQVISTEEVRKLLKSLDRNTIINYDKLCQLIIERFKLFCQSVPEDELYLTYPLSTHGSDSLVASVANLLTQSGYVEILTTSPNRETHGRLSRTIQVQSSPLFSKTNQATFDYNAYKAFLIKNLIKSDLLSIKRVHKNPKTGEYEEVKTTPSEQDILQECRRRLSEAGLSLQDIKDEDIASHAEYLLSESQLKKLSKSLLSEEDINEKLTLLNQGSSLHKTFGYGPYVTARQFIKNIMAYEPTETTSALVIFDDLLTSGTTLRSMQQALKASDKETNYIVTIFC